MAASRLMIDEADELMRSGTGSPPVPTAGPLMWSPMHASAAYRSG